MSKGLCLWMLCMVSLCYCLTEEQEYNLEGRPDEGYYLKVEIGSPPQTFNVLVDTGSANLAIAAVKMPNISSYFMHSQSSSFKLLDHKVSVAYTQGAWHGELASDIIRFPGLELPVVRRDLALIYDASDFFPNGSQWQGILGLGYPGLVRPRASSQHWSAVLGGNATFSLQVCGSRGALHLTTAPLPSSSQPQAFSATVLRPWFYEVALTEIWVGDTSVGLPCTEFNNDKTIVDSGTSNLHLPLNVFREVVRLLGTAAAARGLNVSSNFWSLASVACFDSEEHWKQFPALRLGLAQPDGQKFLVRLPPQSYLHREQPPPLAYNSSHCLRFGLEASHAGTVLGLVFLEGLEVTFDQASRTVSFSNSSCGLPVRLEGPFSSDKDARRCVLWWEAEKDAWLSVAAAVAVVLVAGLVLAVLWCLCQRRRLPHRWPVYPVRPVRSCSRQGLVPLGSEASLTTAA